jgi:GTP-binding protein
MKSNDAVPEVIDANFIAEARSIAGLVAEGPPEVAIAGRSNVGKSTLLNRLAARRALARTSKTPGRTRGLVLYDLVARFPDDEARVALRLVDLPGYGYAQVSHDERKSWQHLVEGYVRTRNSLRLCLILVDARRDLEEEEAQLVEWLEALSMPHRLVVTKVDKLSAGERGTVTTRFKQTGQSPLFVSGETGEGVERIWRVIRGACAAGATPGGSDESLS